MVFGLGEGKLDIVLDKMSFRHGETIKGKLILQLENSKKAKELRVTLIARKKVYEGDKTREIDIVTVPTVLGREQEYHSGEHSFEIIIPGKAESNDPPGLLGDIAKFAQALSTSTVRWYLDASLDLPMSLDISKKVEISVS